MRKSELLVVFTTVDSIEKAESIASACVEKKLVACAQIDGPVTSIYRWDDQVEKSTEYRLMFKTSTLLFEALEGLIHQLHPYDIPEFVAIPIVSGSEKYIAWMKDSLLDE